MNTLEQLIEAVLIELTEPSYWSSLFFTHEQARKLIREQSSHNLKRETIRALAAAGMMQSIDPEQPVIMKFGIDGEGRIRAIAAGSIRMLDPDHLIDNITLEVNYSDLLEQVTEQSALTA